MFQASIGSQCQQRLCSKHARVRVHIRERPFRANCMRSERIFHAHAGSHSIRTDETSSETTIRMDQLDSDVETSQSIDSVDPSTASHPSTSDRTSEVPIVERSQFELWWAALKPPMYSVGFIPVMVGAAAAYYQNGVISTGMCMGLIVAAVLVIAWLNLSNDGFDAVTGVDATKTESVVKLTGNRVGVLVVAFLLLAVGGATLAHLISSTQDWRIGAMLAFSIMCGYVYQSPPFRLSYKGLGEPLCFFAFGPSATSAFYLALSSPQAAAGPSLVPQLVSAGTPLVSHLVLALSILVGITTTVILFTSHWHQIEGDRNNNKFSPLVRLGSTEKALPILAAATAAPYILSVGAAAVGAVPLPALLASLLSLPAAASMLRFAYANFHTPALIAPLKRYATKWHIAYNMCWVVGLLLSRQWLA